jgi:arsenate reductase
MTETRLLRDLAPGEQRLIRRSVEELQREFRGTFDDETVEHFVVDSYERLDANARVKTYIGVLSERFARERLRAMARIESSEPATPSVLFLCVHNAGRSQMAAGWLRAMAGGRVNVYTGGSEPGTELNPVVVEVMAEIGIDIHEEFPKPWTEEIVRAVDVVIAMGCGDVCPIYPGKSYVDWDLADPAGKDLGTVRAIRDEIRIRVEALVTKLGIATSVD